MFRTILRTPFRGLSVKYLELYSELGMETKAKNKKATRSYVRGLLEQLKDLGVEWLVNAEGEILLTHVEGQSDDVTMDKAVGILIAEAPK